MSTTRLEPLKSRGRTHVLRPHRLIARSGWTWALAIALGAAVAACTAQPQRATPQPGGAPADGRSPTTVTRITAGLRASLPTVSKTLNTIIPGATALDRLVSSGLTMVDDKGVLRAQLAEAVPSLDNGLWKVLPDGRMETTWRIRPGTRWHDGAPLTVDDLRFGVAVAQDREIPVFTTPAVASLDRVEAADPQTVTAFWKQPFIDADLLFGKSANDDVAVPMPKHILERVYLEEKAAFTDQPYWTAEFVGTGPFKVREWVAGSGVTLVANEHYVLGRPKVDEVEVRFIPDGATLMANVLAGAVDVTIGERNFSVEEASQAQWPSGTWVAGDRSPIVGLPQLLNPTPAIITNVQFRRALLHAIDRQEMANTFLAGQGEVAHAYASPSNKEYADVQGAAVRYEFDVRRAAQLIESLGYARGQDGFFSDRSGAKPSVEVRTTTTTENQKAALSIADYWQRAGVMTEPHIVPLARTQEAEYRATFPGFEVIRQPGVDVITRVHSSRARLPENNFRGIGGGFNYTRYMNPEHDALVDRYLMTVPWNERMDVLRQLVRHLTDQVIIMGMFYSTEANLLSNRLDNVHPTRSWAAHEWTVKGASDRGGSSYNGGARI